MEKEEEMLSSSISCGLRDVETREQELPFVETLINLFGKDTSE